jgi:excisionase family DNA binding protein|tara:strand:- start:22174 stop:22350 length:177 start_codon:yes stop_codon:yes gene_type:complete
MSNKLLNKKELSEYMGVSIGKIDLIMSDGLKYIKMNRNVRFRIRDVDEYLNRKIMTRL